MKENGQFRQSWKHLEKGTSDTLHPHQRAQLDTTLKYILICHIGDAVRLSSRGDDLFLHFSENELNQRPIASISAHIV